MTIEEKQKIACFLDLAWDTLHSGYKGKQKEYDFTEKETAASSHFIQQCDSLEQIYKEIGACKNCQLSLKRKNTVPGEGVNNPLVMVIGEAPGADEDVQGRPFVGKAGQLLDKMLGSINLTRQTNCYIANIVKCRPPQNRDPHPEERSACIHFLHRQILLHKPKFILLVGSIAAQSLLNTKMPISKIRGKISEYKIGDLIIPLISTFHPAYLLHNEDQKRPVWEDLKLLRSRIEEFLNEKNE
ncbi:MAG: uracil-DNA glycosylase [Treponema sp.]|nr:uracil-DNA glycosylase [Treponema sp.]MCL2250314.1 uracil-DNA glycosylase [Treponema sp.]